MVDVFSLAKRTEVMSRIRGKGNKSTELALAIAFRRAGIKGWRHHVVIRLKLGPRVALRVGKPVLVVRPDFVFRREKVVVFVDGCFWHQCPLHSKVPENNRVFWAQKLARNVERDRLHDRELKKAGWRVRRIWEHEVSNGLLSGRLGRIASFV
ncbi:MAG: very short patch repair endonuclease [Burkholderiaceae bacterium]|nr:very short patch repair endonuclease [Rhodoferax sp.]MCP5284907.1 very short patch repair endonuclease [Burkholderiaceae bacterium]